MHVAFCLFEAGSILTPNLLPGYFHAVDYRIGQAKTWGAIPWERKSGGHGTLQESNMFLHGTECGVCFRRKRNTWSSYMSAGALEHHSVGCIRAEIAAGNRAFWQLESLLFGR